MAIIVMGVALAASTSQAAILSLHWEDTDGAFLTLNEGETATIVTSVELFEDEILSGIGFANTPIPGDPVRQVDFTIEPAGWRRWGESSDGDPSDLNDVLGLVDPESRKTQGVAGWSPAPAVSTNLYGPGTFVVARQTIQLTDEGDGSDLPITFNMTGPLNGAWNYSPLLIDETGDYLLWSVDYATFPGFAALGGYGNPGWDGPLGGQPIPNPLVIQRAVPEPASFVLLGLGGLLFRRKPVR